MCDDLMPTLHERCRVVGANIVAHEKQDFHLSSLDNRSLGMAQSAFAKSALKINVAADAYGFLTRSIETKPMAVPRAASQRVRSVALPYFSLGGSPLKTTLLHK